MKSTRATMRLELLKRLQEENLGLRQIEIFVQNEARSRLSDKFKKKSIRDPSLIESIMRNKIKDAYQAVRETTLAKSLMKKKLNKILKNKVNISEKIFMQLEMEEKKTINMIQKKNDKKISHLKEKASEDPQQSSVPEILAKYENIKIFQQSAQENKDIEINMNVMTIGNVKLDEEELLVLKLPPDFAIPANLSEEDFIHEEEMAIAKFRWEKKKQLEEDLGEENVSVTEEEKEEINIVEAKSRQIFDPINKTLDLRKRRVTDLKENSRVYLPKPLPPQEEAKIEIRREQYEQVFRDHVRDHCSESGTQQSNMSWSHRNGLKKLQKRKKDGDIIVLTTDKSGKFAVSDVESYLAMGAVHTSKDSIIGDDEVRKIQNLHNGHTSMWLRMTNMGLEWNHQDRIKESCLQHTCTVPPMYLLVKDHKEKKEGALPATRPVVSGKSGMGLSMSNILSDMIENIANMRPNAIEIISTEDLLSRVDHYNENVAETVSDDVILTGCDAVQLFPSLRAAESGRAVRESTIEIINETGLTIEGLDFKEIAKYIRMNMTDQEISARKLTRVVPTRKYKRGRMPGMTGDEALKKVEKIERFLYPNIELTNEEEVNMLATALEIAV